MLVSLIIILVDIPRLFRDFTKALCYSPEPPLPTMRDLISRAQNIRFSLKTWYSAHIGPGDPPTDILSLGDGYYKLLVMFYLCSIYSNRLNTCVFWTGTGTSDIDEIEEESQQFAKTIVAFCKDEAHFNLQSSLILAQKLPIAEATIETAEDWKRHLGVGSRPGQLCKMPEQSFKHWCSLFGRTTS
jgi:hypothetical protein